MHYITKLLEGWFALEGTPLTLAATGLSIVALLVAALAAYWLVRTIVIKGVHGLAKRSRAAWDDTLVERKVLQRATHLVPGVLIHELGPVVFRGYASGILISQRIAVIYMLLAGAVAAAALINALVDILGGMKATRKMPLRSFAQVAKIVMYFVVGIVTLAVVMDKSPVYFLSGMGAMAAVLMLVFRDSILGFVAGLHLSFNDMVRVGDWIEMSRYGANGAVTDVTLTTVKVQNWNKTISTIPAYSLLSDSFMNWRGMSESGGRRIKRSVNIDMTSIRFCTQEMLDRFRTIRFITEYIDRKKREIAEHNRQHNVDDTTLVNGRRLTNIGTFRAYLGEYISHHPAIHEGMTMMVRQLTPTENGLPIEIYAFSSDQNWVNYEGIQSDIFDHVLAIIPAFDLRVFQNPTGGDFRELVKTAAG